MSLHELSRPSLLPVIAGASIAILLFLIVQPSEPATRLITRWTPQPMVTQAELPPDAVQAPPPISAPALPVDQFDISVDDGLYPNEREALTQEFEQAFAYVTERFDGVAQGRFQAAVLVDANCGLHGLAYTDVRIMQVFTCPGIGRERVVSIMAHEMVHQLQHDRYGPAHLNADLILLEGGATWGAGTYWLGSQPDFRSYVRSQRANGLFYPLATHYATLDITGMNALYYQWASFVEFLIDTYGREAFDQVYRSGNIAPGSADYMGVYGKGLDVLEQEWIAWLDR